MSRIDASNVYQSDTARAHENQTLGSVPSVRELSADQAPFASEWLKRVNEMSEGHRFARLVPPKWGDGSAPPSQTELQQSLMTSFQKAEASDPHLARVMERYLRLNLEMTHRAS